MIMVAQFFFLLSCASLHVRERLCNLRSKGVSLCRETTRLWLLWFYLSFEQNF